MAKVTQRYWKGETRLSSSVQRDGTAQPLASATVNRELAALRHLFKLAVEEWEVVDKAPRIRLEKEPEGRIRWLEAPGRTST
jgi:site-specific recombinase XerD